MDPTLISARFVSFEIQRTTEQKKKEQEINSFECVKTDKIKSNALSTQQANARKFAVFSNLSRTLTSLRCALKKVCFGSGVFLYIHSSDTRVLVNQKKQDVLAWRICTAFIYLSKGSQLY